MKHNKIVYKHAIKNKRKKSADQFTDSLSEALTALMCKDMDSFWKSWRSKFGNKQCPAIIDGCCDKKDIADRFATVFQSVYVPNSVGRNEQLALY